MPLVFDKPKVPTENWLLHDAAQIASIFIDAKSERIIIALEYGNIVDEQFIPNRNLPLKTVVVEGKAYEQLAVTQVDSKKSLYENIKAITWAIVISAGESGTVV